MTKLTFLGTGTSQGVPVIGCGCWVCSSKDLRDKRLRSSVMITRGTTSIVIDSGPDFRQQMLREAVRHIDGILLTHEHKDHVGGLDDVRAFNYISGQAVELYAEPNVQQIVKKDFDYAFTEQKYPGVPEISLNTIDTTPFRVKDIEVIPVRGMHYKLPILGFRIGGIAYLTDFNSIAEEEIAKIKGVDILIVNALRRESHISHFTLDQALHLSWQVGAGRTYLTHLSHQMGRHSQVERELPENTFLAYDGLVVESKA